MKNLIELNDEIINHTFNRQHQIKDIYDTIVTLMEHAIQKNDSINFTEIVSEVKQSLIQGPLPRIQEISTKIANFDPNVVKNTERKKISIYG